MDQEKELSQEFTFWSLLKFVAPSIFTFVFIGIYQMVDGLFIERYVGDMAISAINLYYPIISLFIAVGIMIGTGGNAVIVKKVGEGKRKEAGQTFSRVMTFTVICGILFTVICLLFATPIMRLCGATDGNIEYLRPYYTMLSTFSLAILLQSELGILIIGEGKTVIAAIVIMVGGDRSAFLEVKPIFELMGRTVRYFGATGAGQYAKMANQIAIASGMIGVAEAVAFAKKAKLDATEVIETISGGAAASWSLSNLAPRMVRGDNAPGFFIKHFIKDMRIALECAEEMHLEMPGLKLAKHLYDGLSARGMEDCGTQALIQWYTKQ